MSEAGLSFETATRRTGVADWDWEVAAAAVTRAETAVRFARSVEARAGVVAMLGVSDGVVIAGFEVGEVFSVVKVICGGWGLRLT